MFRQYNPNDYIWEGNPIAITTHAWTEMYAYDLDANTILSMLKSSFECKKKRKHRKNDCERCSIRKRRTFRIILAHSYCENIQSDCLAVKHVKPA